MKPTGIDIDIINEINALSNKAADEYTKARTINDLRPKDGLRSLSLLEVPVPDLQALLFQPEHRDILVEFVRRYNRESILKSALTKVINQRKDELFTYYKDVSDFPHYIMDIENSEDVWSMVSDYVPEPGIRQKNYNEFCRMTIELGLYAEEMVNPTVYAIEAFYFKGVINAQLASSLIKDTLALTAADAYKISPTIGLVKQEELTAVTRETLISLFEQTKELMVELTQKIQANEHKKYRIANISQVALKLFTTKDLLTLVAGSPEEALVLRHKNAFDEFYSDATGHARRLSILDTLIASETTTDAKQTLGAIKSGYLGWMQGEGLAYAKLFITESSVKELNTKLNQIHLTTRMDHTHCRLVEILITQKQVAMQKFFSEKCLGLDSHVLSNVHEALKKLPADRADPDMIAFVGQVNEMYLESRRPKLSPRPGVANDQNGSPVNYPISPMEQKQSFGNK
jgi:hypothetical protein